MNLENNCCVLQEVLSHKFCNDVVRFGEEQNQQLALTGDMGQAPNNELDLKKLYKTRNSSVAWLDEPWIWRQIQPYILDANKKAGWNFQLDYSEDAQWTKYSKQQHYTWHVDSFKRPFSNPRDKSYGLIRKLSCTISLEDGDTYEGGDLEILVHDGEISKKLILNEARKKGTITVFPAFVLHRVTPVTEGTRYSLVVWTLGQPFK